MAPQILNSWGNQKVDGRCASVTERNGASREQIDAAKLKGAKLPCGFYDFTQIVVRRVPVAVPPWRRKKGLLGSNVPNNA